LILDPLLRLIDIEPIADAVKSALKSIDELNWNRNYRNRNDLVPMARRVGAYASAAIEGAAMPADPSHNPDDSPMGILSQSALGVTAEVEFQLKSFLKTPLQSWARLHSFIESGEERGRPRTNNDVVDPLHIGQPIDSALIESRMNDLVELVQNSKAPAVLIASILHAELATIAPFARGSQMIARATSRMYLQAKQIDQLQLVMPEYGFYKIGRANYAKALIAYKSGTVAGVTEWIETHSKALEIGATSGEFLVSLCAQPN
jgi:hypothetical protein